MLELWLEWYARAAHFPEYSSCTSYKACGLILVSNRGVNTCLVQLSAVDANFEKFVLDHVIIIIEEVS